MPEQPHSERATQNRVIALFRDELRYRYLGDRSDQQNSNIDEGLLTGDMIERCRKVGLAEPEFTLGDGFTITLRRKPERAFEIVGGQAIPRVTQPVAGEVTGQVTGKVGSQPESQPESRPESLELRVLGLLDYGALSKAELSAGLGHKEISGQLNKIIRLLLADLNIEYTIPGKPNSRPQKYRLTDKGMTMLAALRKGTSAP